MRLLNTILFYRGESGKYKYGRRKDHPMNNRSSAWVQAMKFHSLLPGKRTTFYHSSSTLIVALFFPLTILPGLSRSNWQQASKLPQRFKLRFLNVQQLFRRMLSSILCDYQKLSFVARELRFSDNSWVFSNHLYHFYFILYQIGTISMLWGLCYARFYCVYVCFFLNCYFGEQLADVLKPFWNLNICLIVIHVILLWVWSFEYWDCGLGPDDQIRELKF